MNISKILFSGEQSYIDFDTPVYFDAVYDTWTEVRHEIDIDNDIISLYYNNEFIYTWTWSDGSAGSSNILDALNFYGFCAGSGCSGKTWYDNIELCGFENNNSDINETESINVEIYPNPNNGQFELLINNNFTNIDIEIFNLLGEKIYNKTINNYTMNHYYPIDVKTAAGTYILNLKTENYKSEKLIIIE